MTNSMHSPLPGDGGLAVNMVAGRSAVTDLWCANPLKVLTPRHRGPSVWAYTTSFGGGFVAGDQTRLNLTVGTGARCFLTTQASTKIYRNPARRPCSHFLSVSLAKKSLLVLAPDPVQSFADSDYSQSQEFHLEAGAGLVLLDWFCSGRAARGERWNFHSLRSRNEVFMGGKRCLFDSLVLDHAQGSLASAHRLGRFNCVAILAVMGESLATEADALLQETQNNAVAQRAKLIFAASPVKGGALLRVAGERYEDVARLIYRSLGFVSRLLEDDPWARKLQSFSFNN